MKRRTFIKSTTLLASQVNLLPSNQVSNGFKESDRFKGFIVSDAHIGWRGADQPTLLEQEQNIDHIVATFPDLNVAIDTGDIHHGYLNEKQRVVARSQWVNSIANKFNKTPFYYIPGNHELGKGFEDPEVVAGIVGNHVLRPYYSFDIKGIHFISLPQLLDTIYVTEETINWLALDLKLNSNKTTIILSHNSIKNTTFDNGETGYRVVTNSNALMEVIGKHSNVVAWFHGHNHQYQIVKKHDMMFVSNGRIGGFNPPTSWGPFGQGHLGGVYFEITKTELVIKCYSSSKKDFLENLGFPELSIRHPINSTFESQGKANHYYGHGKMTDGINLKSKSHHTSETDEQMHYIIESSPINENSHFKLETNYFFAGRSFDKVIGHTIRPKDTLFDNVETGLQLTPKTKEPVTLIAPVTKDNEDQGHVRGSYYRFSDQINYRVQLSLDLKTNVDTSVFMVFEIFDKHYTVLKRIDHRININADSQQLEHVFKPDLAVKENPEDRLYFRIKFVFENSHNTFVIHHLKINPASPNSKSCDQYLEVQTDHSKQKFILTDESNLNAPTKISNKNAPFARLKAKLNSDQLLCFIIKKSNVQWQSRNATATVLNNQLTITKNTNPYVKTDNIILAPFNKMHFYIYQLQHIENAQITYDKSSLQIGFNATNETQSILYLYAEKRLNSFSGIKVMNQKLNHYQLLPLKKSGQIIIEFQA